MDHNDTGIAQELIRQRLFALQDMDYRVFHSRLMPTVDPDTVIGVRVPALRKLAKELWREAAGKGKEEPGPAGRLTRAGLEGFLGALPHAYYEENNLHGFFIELIKDYDACIEALDAFLPYVDNWATCDMTVPKALGRHKKELLSRIRVWIADSHPYTVRFAIGMLMRLYLEEDFEPAYPRMVAEVKSEEYYVNMMRAWYFATALAARYEEILPYLEENRLDLWTHNRSIQKAVESYRITPEQKEYLKGLRRKKG